MLQQASLFETPLSPLSSLNTSILHQTLILSLKQTVNPPTIETTLPITDHLNLALYSNICQYNTMQCGPLNTDTLHKTILSNTFTFHTVQMFSIKHHCFPSGSPTDIPHQTPSLPRCQHCPLNMNAL